MNENDSPSNPTGSGSEPDPRPAGFFGWLRRLDIVRSSQDRWFAGVAAGVAARANIDPIIVRGIFVVLAILGGPGLLLYLAGWLLLPDRQGRIHAEEIVRGRASTELIVTASILLALVLLPVFFGFSFSIWGWGIWGVVPEWIRITFTVLFWAVLVPGLVVWFIIWLSSSNRGSRPSGPSAHTEDRSRSFADRSHEAEDRTADSSSRWGDDTGRRAEAWGEDIGRKAEAWGEDIGRKAEAWGEDVGRKAEAWGDDLGRKTTAWSEDAGRKAEAWGERYSEEYGARQFGAGSTILSLALALIAGGVTLLWAMGAGVSAPYGAALIAAAAVLGIASIVAGIRGRDTGWVGFFSFVGVLALVFLPFTSAQPRHTEVVPFGNVTVNATDESQDRAILIAGGNATIDLSGLDGRATPRVINVWLLAGNVTVEMPASHPARVQIGLAAGNIRDERIDTRNRQGGIFMGRTLDGAAAGSSGADATVVRVHQLAGNVYIDGAPALPTDSVGSSRTDRIERQITEQEEQLQQLREELENER